MKELQFHFLPLPLELVILVDQDKGGLDIRFLKVHLSLFVVIVEIEIIGKQLGRLWFGLE